MGTADFLEPITALSELQPGQVFVRKGGEKHQQGGFLRLTDDGTGAILVNVIDLTEGTFVAEAGIVKPDPGDELFRHAAAFSGSQQASAATEILTSWTLFREHAALQSEMLEFMRTAFSAEQVVALKKSEDLRFLFVPLQQRFKIGKFTEKVDWKAIELERFGTALLGLEDGKHMTYVAFVPRDTTHKPRFYTIGTKPHLETMTVLGREPFAFKPNNGGHIKILSGPDETPRRYIVDAGSNDLGSGIHTSLATAELVVENLKRLYPEHEYKPVAGRGAYGIQQSY